MSCSCMYRDPQACAVDLRLTMLSCPCACHTMGMEAFEEEGPEEAVTPCPRCQLPFDAIDLEWCPDLACPSCGEQWPNPFYKP